MGYKVIAPVGDNLRALFFGLKEFPTERVILISPTKYLASANKLSKQLGELTIDSEIIEVEGNTLEEMFKVFGKLCNKYPEDELIVNVATGDRMTSCAALSAAFANGLKTFGVMDGKIMLLPIIKLSYYQQLNENKLKILAKLDANKYHSLKELSKDLKMSISLLSYHLNGNYKAKGLKEFRLVDIKEENKNLYVKLSELGNLLIKGYIRK